MTIAVSFTSIGKKLQFTSHIFLYSVVNASLTEVSYIVNEEDGLIEGCVVLDGLIQREVVIQLFSLDNTAIGSIH